MATYYIDFASGNDASAGTSTGSPWKTLPGTRNAGDTDYQSSSWGGGTISSTNKVPAGTVFKIKSGTTHGSANGGRIEINSTFYATNAGAGSPITIQRDTAWGTGAITFDGTGMTIGTWAALFMVNQVPYVQVSGIVTDGLVFQDSGFIGVQLYGTSEASKTAGNTLAYAKLVNNSAFNLMIQRVTNFSVDWVNVDGNNVKNATSGGVHIGGQNDGCASGTLSNCKSYNHGVTPGATGGGTDTMIGFYMTNCTDITFTNCISYGNECDGFDMGVVGGPPSTITNNIKFIDCVTYNNADGFGCNLDNYAGAANFYYVNCIAYNNNLGWDIYQGPTAYLYNCITANNDYGIYIDAPAQSNRNTSVTIKNSIFYKNAKGANKTDLWCHATADLTLVSDYNHWEYGGQTRAVYWNPAVEYDPYFYDASTAPGSVSRTWSMTHGQDAHSTCSQDGELARFTDGINHDYTLLFNSSLIGAAVAIADAAITEVLTDKAGFSRPQGAAWDIGAYEFVDPAVNGTTVGTATAVAASTASINVSMPFTGDDNSNNSYTVDYKRSVDSEWTNWVTDASHIDTPYITTITGLNPGTNYDVRCTYADADSVTGTNPQTITAVTTFPAASVGTFPANVTVNASDWALVSNSRSFTSELNGVTQTEAIPGDKWKASLTFSNKTLSESRVLRAFIAGLRGRAGRFYLTPPEYEAPAGTALGSPLVNGIGQVGSSLVTDGWTSNQTGALLPGDYFQVGSELKMVTATADADSGGNAVISFVPPLRVSPGDNAQIVITSPKCVMMLADGNQSRWSIIPGKIYALSIAVEEALDI